MGLPAGVGFAPLGYSQFGYGKPLQNPSVPGNILQQSINGPSGDARYIDPSTRDYVIDANGFIVGQSAIDQAVFLALMTTLGTSVNPTLGSELSKVKTYDVSTIRARIKNIATNALASLIKAGSVTLVDVVTIPMQNSAGINITVIYKNNITQQVNKLGL